MIDEKDEYRLSQQSHLDAEWKCLQGYLPPLPKRGRPPIHVARGPFSMRSSTWLCTGCPWRYLPANFPPWQTVFYHFRRLRRVWDLDALVYGRCTALDANDKEGILTQVPKAGILKA